MGPNSPAPAAPASKMLKNKDYPTTLDRTRRFARGAAAGVSWCAEKISYSIVFVKPCPAPCAERDVVRIATKHTRFGRVRSRAPQKARRSTSAFAGKLLSGVGNLMRAEADRAIGKRHAINDSRAFDCGVKHGRPSDRGRGLEAPLVKVCSKLV
jgi:hypothetical protein